MPQLRLVLHNRCTVRYLPPGPAQRAMPRIVTRPVIDSIASVTRPSWRNVVALRHWLRHAKTVIMSGMGGGSLCRILGWGIHSLHVAQPPCLISVLAKVLLMDRNFKRTFLPAPPGAYPRRARAPAASQPCRQQARAAGHGQAGWLVTGSLRGWGCSGGTARGTDS